MRLSPLSLCVITYPSLTSLFSLERGLVIPSLSLYAGNTMKYKLEDKKKLFVKSLVIRSSCNALDAFFKTEDERNFVRRMNYEYFDC